MKKQLFYILTAAALQCVLAPMSNAQNMAVVNGKPIPMDRFTTMMAIEAKAGRPVAKEKEEELKQALISREVWVQAATARHLDTTEDYKFQLELNRQNLLIRTLFLDYQNKNPVTDEEAKAEYDKLAAGKPGKFDDVKAQIVKQLQQQKLAKFQEELRAQAKVE